MSLQPCHFVQETHPDHPTFMLSGNTDTDKKHSAMNTIMTRGKRVIAEVTIPADALRDIMKLLSGRTVEVISRTWTAA